MKLNEFKVDGVTIATLLDRQSMKWRRYPPDVIPMWVADMDFGVAPCVQAVMEKLTAKGDYGYALRDGEVPAVAVSKAFSCRMNEKFADTDLPAISRSRIGNSTPHHRNSVER